MKKGELIINQLNQLELTRKPYEQMWENVRIFTSPLSPQIYNFSKNNNNNTVGSNVSDDQVDATAIKAMDDLTAAMTNSLCPPNLKWVQLESTNPNLNNNDAVRNYFQDVEDIIFSKLGESNFYSENGKVLSQIARWGTGCMSIELDDNFKLNFRSYYISEFFIAENHLGEVDTLFRKYNMTAKQLVQQFGRQKVSDSVKKMVDAGNLEEMVTVIYAVYPRLNRKKNSKGEYFITADNKPFASVYVEEDSAHILKESGFDNFPYAVGFWNREAGQIYGISPAMNAMADIKSLNKMEELNLKLAELIAFPPKAVIGKGIEQVELSYVPASVSYIDFDADIRDMVSGQNYPISKDKINDKINSVREQLHADKITAILSKTKEMSATESIELRNEVERILGPNYRRGEDYLTQVIIRTFELLSKVPGVLPDIPEELLNENGGTSEYKTRFINRLSIAQRETENLNLNRFINDVVNVSNVIPGALDNINVDNLVAAYVANYGVDSKTLNTKDQVENIRKQRAAAQQREQQIRDAQIQGQLSEQQAKSQKMLSDAG